jgi:hypothetical protein
MSKLKIFTDEHIGKAVVEQLQRRGVDVLRCEDVDMKGVDDRRLLEYAAEHGYALLSMDDDVTILHTEWVKAKKPHCGIFYAPMAQFFGPQGIGPIVLFCAEWADLIGGDADELAENIHNQLLYIKKTVIQS